MAVLRGGGKWRNGMDETEKKTARPEEEEAPSKAQNVMHVIGNVLGIVLCVVFIPIILLNTVLIVKSFSKPTELPSVFGITPVIVLSGSMSPTFHAGDMIFLQSVDPETLEQGDVICFYGDDKNSAVTHRIVSVQTENDQKVFVTRGDANGAEDSAVVTMDMVHGKYTGFFLAGLGDMAIFLQSPLGMIVCVACPLFLIVLWDVLRRAISAKKKAGKNQAMEEELERLRAQVAQQAAGTAPAGDQEETPPAP